MKDGYRVKICGTTSVEDAMMAAEAGADFFGVVVEVSFSPRSLTIDEAKSLFENASIPAVALVFNMSSDRLDYLIEALNPFAIQFLNQEETASIERLKKSYPHTQIWQSIHLPCAGSEEADFFQIKDVVKSYQEAGADLLLYDTVATLNGRQKFGGTGLVSDWSMVKKIMSETKTDVPVFLAGGINPDNVAQALTFLEPDGIDLCSGVEALPGKKDKTKLDKLMNSVNELNRRK